MKKTILCIIWIYVKDRALKYVSHNSNFTYHDKGHKQIFPFQMELYFIRDAVKSLKYFPLLHRIYAGTEDIFFV